MVFLAGIGTLGVEMVASRLLAPYFGTSQVIWAGVCTAEHRNGPRSGRWSHPLSDRSRGSRSSSAFLLFPSFVPPLNVAADAALGRTTLFNMGSPLYNAFAMERSDEAVRPLAIGLINGAYGAGYVMMPLISTRVQERYGFAPPFVATTTCYALVVLANHWFFRLTDARPAPAAVQPSIA